MRVYPKSLLVFLILFGGCLSLSFAQSKKPIDHSVYENWKVISNSRISHNGQYAAFEINPQKGDGELHLYNLKKRETLRLPRGEDAAFSPMSGFVVYRIKPEYDTVRAKKLKKIKKDKLPKDSVGIYIIDKEELLSYPKLKNFQLPEEASDWLALLLETTGAEKPETDTTEVKDEEAKSKSKKKKKDKTNTLLLLNPVSGDSVSYDHVTHYSLSKNGQACAFIQARKDSIDSVFVSVFKTENKELIPIFESHGFSENIAMDEQGLQLAFTFSEDTLKNKAFDLIYHEMESGNQLSLLNTQFEGANEDWFVSQHGKIFFNEAGDELYFGTAARPYNAPEDTLTDDEKVSLDIWNWKDPYLQTHQLKLLDREKKRNYAAVFYPDEERSVQLGSPDIERVDLDAKAQGAYSLGTDNKPYRKMISWDGSRYKDVYLIDRRDGSSRKVLEKVASRVSLSPQQNYIAWYSIADSSWNIYSRVEGSSVNVTKDLGVNFYNELNDTPNEANPYGMAGWTADEKLVVYDRYDLWQIDPADATAAVNLTNSDGRNTKNRFRYIRLDPEEMNLPEKMLLSAFNEETRQSGYYWLDNKKGKPEQKIYGDYYFRNPKKAKEAEVLLWTRESFTEFPDLYSSKLDFSKIHRITDANPQQKNYNWGTTELVEWVSFNGDSLQGILVKPEDFDPDKKYPMLVYFYERSTSRLNRYYAPKPIRSTINWTYYASNGYLVFVPDIVYRTGYPGPSAYDCVVSGTMAMCERFDFIDRDRLGIQGQSWGGYQTAYIITQTDLYRAAMAGAPVSNMTSAYGGIRWGSGLNRAFQYEETQSRIGTTLWERRDLYILNSPLFFADRIKTPLLMMHNDADGAVPWYQGIEMFTAMRRLNKPVWMLVYNNAPHNLRRRADMEDLTVRMQQFFDHFLKDEPEPRWMKEGVPAIYKGRELGLEVE